MKKLYYIAALAAIVPTTEASATEQSRLSARTAAVLRAPAASRDGSQQVYAYITCDPSLFDEEAFAATGARPMHVADGIITATVPLPAIAEIAELPGVIYIEVASPATQTLDVSKALTGMDRVHSGEGLPSPFTGKGVVVGIVDSGFDYGHAAFRAPDGSLRIKSVWEQGSVAPDENSVPQPFGYGTELTEPGQILQAGGDIRNNSHGTHVTSIAAGHDPYFGGTLAGMAPEADIVLVSMTDGGVDNVNISNAIAYIFDYAARAGKPCVVNLSLGSFSGPHDGTSTFDVLADRLQGPGRLIVGASGNNRATSHHVTRAFTASEQDGALRTFVDFRRRGAAGEVEIWASGADEATTFEVSLLVVKTSTGDVAQSARIYPAEGVDEPDLGRNVSGSFTVSSEICPLNGKVHLWLRSGVTSVRTGYAVAIEVKATGAGAADIWADNVNLGLTSLGLTGYSDQGDASTVCEIGGTARRILTVGAYTSRSSYMLLGESAPRTAPETDGALSTFSGGGPTADGRMKPQVTAPGCMISAAVSINDNSGTLLYSAHHNDGERDYMYGYMQGTSMATPVVTGIVATWLEAYPELTPEQLEQVVRATARSDAFTGDLSEGSNDWGYGKADGFAGLAECLRLAGIEGIGSVSTDGGEAARMLADARLLFTKDVADAVIEVYSPSGALLHAERHGKIQAGESVKLPVAEGVALVRVASSAGVQTFKSF